MLQVAEREWLLLTDMARNLKMEAQTPKMWRLNWTARERRTAVHECMDIHGSIEVEQTKPDEGKYTWNGEDLRQDAFLVLFCLVQLELCEVLC